MGGPKVDVVNVEIADRPGRHSELDKEARGGRVGGKEPVPRGPRFVRSDRRRRIAERSPGVVEAFDVEAEVAGRPVGDPGPQREPVGDVRFDGDRLF